jgi:hypothetical protein
MSDWLNNLSMLTPEEFEIYVQKTIENSGINLEEFHTARREKLKGTDGEYEIDIIARFTALKTSFVVLIECKHHKNPIKREVVQILNDRLRTTSSQKGMIFTSGQFQSGAIEYAKINNIALVKITDKEPVFYNNLSKPTTEQRATRVGSYLVKISKDGKTEYTKLGLYVPELIFDSLGIESDHKNDSINFTIISK